MVTIKREIQLDYGHTLPNHFSFCNQLHGHRGRVIATVEGDVNTIEGNSSQGMVLDFKILKELMTTHIHDVLDHGFAVWEKDTLDLEFVTRRNTKYLITPEPPTAEYLAKWSFNQLQPLLPPQLRLVSMEWYETVCSSAIYLNPSLDNSSATELSGLLKESVASR